jgi:hypothetical protein
MTDEPRRLTASEAENNVAECRQMVRRAINSAHPIVIEHMAQTWECIARVLAKVLTV